ncbi:MAG: hypothetical protein JWM88_3265 [Verrucomicrobia bacterium]|nr:hypothetical protein [Verrucomicrobiota bacterium]
MSFTAKDAKHAKVGRQPDRSAFAAFAPFAVKLRSLDSARFSCTFSAG